MISAEVQRTLVKSPPELWAELSDEDALARHLGALGEIKITTTKPEQTVEWEAEAAHGKVELKPSGWGTKVTLSVTREAPVEARDALRAEQVEERPLTGEGEPASAAMAKPAPEAVAGPAPEAIAGPAPEAVAEPAPEAGMAAPLSPEEDVAAPTTEKPSSWRRGFFARLFHRRSVGATVDMTMRSTAKKPGMHGQADAAEQPEASKAPAAVEEPMATDEPTATAEVAEQPPAAEQPPTTEHAPDPEPSSADLAAELAAVEEEIAQQTTELLNGVLDRLGAAHHRPFSRA